MFWSNREPACDDTSIRNSEPMSSHRRRHEPRLADAWIAAWEVQAAQHGLERGSAYWEGSWAWIAAQRKTRRLPD
jgi:hypothetical protein